MAILAKRILNQNLTTSGLSTYSRVARLVTVSSEIGISMYLELFFFFRNFEDVYI